MSYQRRRWFWVVCTIAMGAVWLAGFPACVQSQTNQSDGEEVARTAWGDPDLRGIWNNATITPLQRPESLGDKAFLTAEEVAETEQQAAERHRQANAPSEVRTEPFPVTGSLVSAYNSFWTEQGTAVVQTGRTSLISDPPNGRLPPLTSAAEVRIASPAYHRLADVRDGRVPADGPEEMGLSERCLWYRGIGHISPTGYNNNYQFFQTPDHVVILQEHIHDVRYVPLDGRPHLPATIRQYAGDSRGHWDGDTLVVETTNIREAFIRRWNLPQHSMGRGDLSGQVTLVERFTRTGPDTLDYQFTVEDPIRKRGRSPGRVRCRWHVLTARSTSSRVTRATMRCSTCLLDRGLRRVPQRNEGNPMKAHDPMKVTDMDQRDARLCIGHNRSGRLCNKFAGSHAQTQY